MSVREEYENRFPLFEQIAKKLKSDLEEVFNNFPRIDRISTRAKSIDRFAEKAEKIDAEGGKQLYEFPLEEIQDQIGARIVVFYKSDVDPIADQILEEFREVEDIKKEHPDPKGFSYEARHFICFLPKDIATKFNPPIDFFELQVSTLFQHAWSEANHDLGYKPKGELPFDEERRIAWAAAQAWGADTIFDELWNKQQEGK